MNVYLKSLKPLVTLSIGALLLVGCHTECDNNDSVVPETDGTLPTIENPTFDIQSKDEATGTVYIHITSVIANESSTNFYDNNVVKTLDDGSTTDGFITLDKGRHRIKVCATNDNGQVCSDEQTVVVSKKVEDAEYKQIPIESASAGLTNNGTELIYGTESGQIYSLNISTKESTFLSSVNEMINGLVYRDRDNYYYTSVQSQALYALDIANQTRNKMATVPFPDGLDKFQNKLYHVTNDASGVLTVRNLDDNKVSTLNTHLDDMVGVSHTEKFLYVLSEDGHIYQIDSNTGASVKIFDNTNLFTKGNNNLGLEAITILNKKVYVSYIDDSSIYLIDIDLSLYE